MVDDGITAYHGSPHDFEQFDTSKIGTGEGAQAYGHGLYFAEHEPVAEGYRDKLAMGQSTLDKRPMSEVASEKYKLPYGTDPTIEHDIADIVSSYGDTARSVMEARHPQLLNHYDKLVKEGRIKQPGHMYEVAIDAHPDHMLDWDKPLSEQSEHVKGAFNNVINTYGKVSPFSGGKAYQDLERIMGFIGKDSPNEETSKVLHQHGIHGIRYLDERSRGDKPWVLKHPQGGVNEFPNEKSAKEFHARNPEYSIEPPKLTHNYVIFDRNRVSIKRKYEQGGEVEGYGRGGETEDYRGGHQAPRRNDDVGAPLHDTTGVYPADLYSPKGLHYYGDATDPIDQESYRHTVRLKGKPEAPVRVYRAVPHEPSSQEKLAKLESDMAAYQRRKKLPNDAGTTNGSQWYNNAYDLREKLRTQPNESAPSIAAINPGDWVTPSRAYAKLHGDGVLRGKYKILSKMVKAKDVFTNGDSLNEWGYDPEITKAKGGTIDREKVDYKQMPHSPIVEHVLDKISAPLPALDPHLLAAIAGRRS